MRAIPITLAAVLAAGCQTATAPTAPETPAPRTAPTAPETAAPAVSPEPHMARWEQQWEDAKVTLSTARSDAAEAGAAVPPELDRQVTELLDLQIGTDQGDEARIEDLQDAVSDALRLAELLSVG